MGQRVDRALVEAFDEAGSPCTRSQLARAFEAGGVTTSGRRLKPAWIVDSPVQVDVVLVAAEPLSAEPEAIALDVVHEDDDVLVIDKPPGMVVHPAPGHPGGTLVNAVLHHLGVGPGDLPILPGNELSRPGIVHRLDRETSGLIVVARHARAQEQLAAQFRAHDLERSYLGIVVGEPKFDEQRVETRHGRDPKDRRRFAPDVDEGRAAITNLVVERRLAGAALIRFQLETGRTHQIRMHARHLGHPILADALYGRPARDRRVRDAADAVGRQALHAATLGFRHPKDDRAIGFESPIPPDMRAALAKLASAS